MIMFLRKESDLIDYFDDKQFEVLKKQIEIEKRVFLNGKKKR